MSGAREIIEILSKILCENGTSEIKAESFRSAKFDKDIATPSLWRLLFELIFFLQHNVVDENPKDLGHQLKAEELVAYTKRVMQDHGYLCEDFSKLPDDMTKGSREVLLAVGWLISTKNVIDRLIDLKAVPFNQEFPNSQTVVLDQSGFHENSKNDIIHRIRKVQLLNGQLCLSLKRLHSLYREETTLQHRIHECTAGVGSLSHRQHLSVFEVHLLRHPDQLKKSLKQLEKDNSRLEYILKWKEHEHIFWKWMESVLHLKIEEKSPAETSQPFLHYNLPEDLVRNVSSVRRSLEAKIMKLDPIITQLEELWETKQEDLPVKSLGKIDAAIKSEIDLIKHKVYKDMFPCSDSVFPSLYQNSRLVYTKPQKKKVSNVQIPELSNIEEDNLIDIRDETNALMDHINRLECEVMRKERFYKSVLDEMAAKIPGAICIQPASLTRSKRCRIT